MFSWKKKVFGRVPRGTSRQDELIGGSLSVFRIIGEKSECTKIVML
jgi:hypothetical protein